MDLEFQHLKSGNEYIVTQEFTDFQKELHPVGEKWEFLGSHFVPYDDGLLLYVKKNGQKTQIKLQWVPKAQAKILDNFEQYIEKA